MGETAATWVRRVLGMDVTGALEPEPTDPDDPTGLSPDEMDGVRYGKTKTTKKLKSGATDSKKKPTVPVLTPPNPDKLKCEAAVNDFLQRYRALATSFEMADERDTFVTDYTEFNTLRKAGDFAQASSKIDDVDGKLKALETLAAEMPAKTKAAAAEANRVNKLKDSEIKKLSASDKAAIVRKLLAGGEPTGDVRKAQIKIYNAASLDKPFMKADEARGKAIAKELKADKTLKAARKSWKTASDDDKIKLLKKIVAVQSKHLGIPTPEIVTEVTEPKDGLITNGYFAPSDGKLHINMHPKSSVQNFQRAVDLAIHENAHNWQAWLVKKLKDGTLKEGDVEYEQALMFAVNNLNPGGYIKGSENFEAYKKQPMEDHSHTTGPKTAKKIMRVI